MSRCSRCCSAEIARRQDRLNAIAPARARLEQRQRDADLERGRSDDDDRRPKGKDGKPKGGRYKREFGTPEDSARDNFTDPDSRIMKRAGGGYDASHNAQTAVDDTAHIIVAAELTNNASDAGELPTMLHAVKNNLGQTPEQALAREHNLAGTRRLLAHAGARFWSGLGEGRPARPGLESVRLCRADSC